MQFKWNPGWNGPVSVAFVVFSSALALIVRRKWKLAQIRRAEVTRLMRLAVAEAERAEKEAAAELMYAAEKPEPVVAGGAIGVQNCAVCQIPTTNRCSRCKSVRYCSGNCQITHWRQGHKYECHPPLIHDHYKYGPNVPVLRDNETLEVSSSGLEGKGHVTTDDFYVSNMVRQPETSTLIDSRTDTQIKASDGKYLEISSTIPSPSTSNLYSKLHSDDGEDSKKHFVSTSVNGASYISMTTSSCSTTSGPVKIPDSSSNVDLARPSTGHHYNLDAPDKLEESSPSSSSSGQSLGSPRTEFIDSDYVNFSSFADATEKFDSGSTCLLDKTKSKLSAPSNMNWSSPSQSKDARLCGNTSIDSSFYNAGKSKASSPSKGYCEVQGEILDSNAVEIVILDDSTASQISNIHHPQLDKGLHAELVDKVFSMSSSSSTSIGGRSDFKGTINFEQYGLVPRESSTKQSKFSPSTKDHSASVDHGHSSLGNGSLNVEHKSIKVEHKSLKVDAFLPNGIVSTKRTEQLSTSSSLLRHGQSGLSSKGYGRYNCKMFFPYDDFIRLYNSDKVEMRPCGLVNTGNSCYANAVLQCLAFTRPLAAFVLEGLHSKTCPKKGWCFTCEFEALVAKVKGGKSPLTPTGILSHIHDIGSNFGRGREEDAHEFLRYSIDAMQSACLKEAGVSSVSELAEETTLIQQIFGGYLRSKIKCMRCQGKSEKRDRMLDLTVDIHGDIGTLEEALARFTASEILEGENKYRCDSCKSFQRAKKQLTILEAPNVLTIALKRYQSGKYGKLNKTVHFPEYLNLSPYMRGSDDNSPVYRLYAVVVHKCHMNATFSGHYVCYVKNSQGMWFKTDDSTVKQVDVQKVLSQGAYMLLYSRISPRAPSLLRKELTKKIKRDHVHISTIPRPFQPGSKAGHNPHNPDKISPHFGPHDLFDERFRRPPKVDSCSDCSSLFSCSDEGSSWSTESAKDSTTSDEFGDQLSGESGYANFFPAEAGGYKGRENSGEPFLYSIRRYDNLTEQSSSGRRRSTGWANSGEPKSNGLFRRSSGDRGGAQTFY